MKYVLKRYGPDHAVIKKQTAQLCPFLRGAVNNRLRNLLRPFGWREYFDQGSASHSTTPGSQGEASDTNAAKPTGGSPGSTPAAAQGRAASVSAP